MPAKRVLISAAGILATIAAGAAVTANGASAPQRMSSPIVGVVRETEVRIAPEIAGRLATFQVAAGQQLHPGDVIATLNSPELAAAVEEARANLQSARANLANVLAGVRKEEIETSAQNVAIATSNLMLAQQQHARYATLVAKDYTSKQQFDESEASLKDAEAKLELSKAVHAQNTSGATKEARAAAARQVDLAAAMLESAKTQLEKSKIRAPSEAIVRLLVAEPGEAISPGQPIATLAAGRERWFTFTIREDRLAGLTIGTPIELETSKGERFSAKATELRPLGEFAVWRAARAVGDHDINSFRLRAEPTGATPTLEPGMSVWITGLMERR
jgi:multidrug resistance efflux pump